MTTKNRPKESTINGSEIRYRIGRITAFSKVRTKTAPTPAANVLDSMPGTMVTARNTAIPVTRMRSTNGGRPLSRLPTCSIRWK